MTRSDDTNEIMDDVELQEYGYPIKYPEEISRKENKKYGKTSFIHELLLNRTMRAMIVTIAVAICLPTLAYVVFYSRELNPIAYVKEYGTCGYYDIYFLPCGPKNISEQICKLRGCCFMYSHGCYHSLPSRHRYLTSSTPWSNNATLVPALSQTSLDGEMAVDNMRLIVNEISADIVEIQITSDINAKTNNRQILEETKNYNVMVFEPSIYVEIHRKSTNATLFSSAKGPWIASKNYFEWSMHLQADILMGLGHHRLEVGDKFFLLNNQSNFAAPFVMGFNKKEKTYHAIYFPSDSPLEVEIMDTKLVLIRGFTSTFFHVFILVGPTPAEIYQQIRSLNTNPYDLTSYWQLGVHLCDDIAKNFTETTQNLRELLKSDTFPFDSHCLMENLIWLSNAEIFPNDMKRVRDELRSKNKRFVASVVTPLEIGESRAYRAAHEANLLLKWSNDDSYFGEAFSRNVSYVDFAAPGIDKWLASYWNPDEIDADGYFFQGTWLPDDRKFVAVKHELPYVPDLMNDTMRNLPPWNVTKPDGTRFLLQQNEAPTRQVNRMQEKINKNKEIFLLTSTPSINVHAMSYRQHVAGTWRDFRNQVKYLAALCVGGYNLYGFPVCGSYVEGDTVNEELCIRWYQFATVMPIFRMSTTRFVDKFSSFAQRTLLGIIQRRYTLLDYMMSTLTTNDLLLRPIIYDFPEQLAYAENFTSQFMIGESLMVVPVTLPAARYISIYFPDTFYELWGGMQLVQTRQRLPVKAVDYPVVLSDFPIFLRSGRIIALHNVKSTSLTADAARLDAFYLKIGLACHYADDYDNNVELNRNLTRTCSASGEHVFTSQITWKFVVTDNELSVTVATNAAEQFDNLFCAETASISRIISWADVYGLERTSETNDVEIQSKRIQMNWNVCDFELNVPKMVQF
ncbi:uncharacterized protein LOC134837304 [Culicoides brevitarsis]|uniref:uncharacterized protein LOC134837304 n=1 Tax=Culicoides brevitarsis TaxID=469753 RepID=UPI00307B24AF